MARVSGLKIAQVNCQRSYGVMCELGQTLVENSIDVALLQEPYVDRLGIIRGLPLSMRVFVCGKDGKSAIVVVRSDLDATQIMLSEDDWGACAWIGCELGDIYLCSLYCRHGHSLDPYINYLERLLNRLGNEPMFMGLDANAVSPLWHSKNRLRGALNVVRGEMLAEFALVKSLDILNEPSEWYTFAGPTGRSDIDVTLSRGLPVSWEIDWRIEPDWSSSDHNIILISVSGEPTRQVLKRDRWNTSDESLRSFALMIASSAEDYGIQRFLELDVDGKVETLDCWTQVACEECLVSRPSKSRGRIKWWNADISCTRRRVRKLRRAYQRARRIPNVDRSLLREKHGAYKRADNAYKEKIFEAKENNWRQFVGDVGNRDPWGGAYKICRGRYKTRDIECFSVEDTVTNSWTESAEFLIRRFFPGNENVTPSMEDRAFGPMPIVPEITAVEVGAALRRMRLGGAPGDDGVTVKMARYIYRAIPVFYLAIFNHCLETGNFPESWKKANVVIIPKGGDKPRCDPSSCRPICLLPVHGKVFERVLVNRLRYAERGLSSAQFGFRGGLSTEDAWHEAIDLVRNIDFSYALGVFIDFRGAFDHLLWDSITRELANLSCPELEVWKSFFRDRTACMRSSFNEIRRSVSRGCPQGSVSGPLMWNIVMDRLLKRLGVEGCGVVAYADDLLIVVGGNSRKAISDRATYLMGIVQDWGDRVGVTVNSDKSVCMLLKGSLSAGRPPVVRTRESRLRYARTVRYLGITVGERIGFGPHFDSIQTKITSIVGNFRRILRKEWGLRKRSLRLIYRGLFVQCALYGASVWGESMRYDYARRRIGRVQRVVLSAMLPVCRTVSTPAMQVLFGEAPWDLEASRRRLAYFVRKGLDIVDVGPRFLSANVEDSDHALLQIKANMIKEWQSRWDAESRGRVTYEFLPVVDLLEARYDVRLTLCSGYLLTGHGSLNGYLYERGLSGDPRCACGGVSETALHVLCHCPLYEDLRNLSEYGIYIDDDGRCSLRGLFEDRSDSARFDTFRVYAEELFNRRNRAIDNSLAE